METSNLVRIEKANGPTIEAMTELSVVIPTYNRKESLLRTLHALDCQTFPAEHFEVVVISDGSTDGSAAAIAAFKPGFALKFVEQQNQGPSVARNHGARLAAGPLLVYVDDDIEPVRDFLAVHFAEQQGCSNLVLIGPQSGPMHEPMSPWVRWEHQMLQKQYDNFKTGIWSAGPNNLYSGNFSLLRKHLLAAGGFNEQFTRQEDVELGFRLAELGLRFKFSAEAVGIHRPTRTFASWYKTPFEYGKRDVEMARDMGEMRAMELARRHFKERNMLTRIAARACIGLPVVEPMALAIGCLGARYGGRLSPTACSLLFNLRYLQGMCREMGGRRPFWEALSESTSP